MPIGIAILDFVGKEVGKKAFSAITNEYFPDNDTFDIKVISKLGELDRKIGSIAQDTSYQRIQPTKDKYIGCLHYFGRELAPYLHQEAKRSEPDLARLNGFVKETRKRRLSLGEAFEQGKAVFNERLSTCDYPERTLLEILQQIAALQLAFLSWEYALTKASGATEDTLSLIGGYYRESRLSCSKFIRDSIEPLCEARLSKMHFSSTAKKNLEGWPQHVKYEYRDSFASNYAGDPFAGDAFDHRREVEIKFYDISIWGDKKKRDTGEAYDEMVRYSSEYKAHRSAVERLNDEWVRQPAKAFLEKLDALSENLPTP